MKIKRSIFRDLVQALEYMYNNEYSSKLQRTPATEKKVARIRRRKLKKLCYTKPTKANRLIKSVYHRKKIMRNLGLYCALWPDLTKNRQDVLKYFLASVFHQRRKRLSMLYKLSRKYKYVRLPRS
jgi:hypothetical protein